MKKNVELLQNLDPKALYEQFTRAVKSQFKFIKELPEIPKKYSTFIVSFSALKIGKKYIRGMAIKFCTYTDGKGTKEILLLDGSNDVSLDTYEQVVDALAKMKKKFKFDQIDLAVTHEMNLLKLQEK